MNTIIKSFKGLAVMSAVSLALAGCSEDVMDRVNQDTSHTNSVDGKFILADVLTSTAFSNVSGDFNTYSSSYVEYEVGIENQLYNAEIRLNEPSASSTFENIWSGVYSDLKKARIIISQCQEGQRDEGNLLTRGIAEVMEAYNGALLADMFGDTPYSEASLVDENGSPLYMNPKMDKQEEVYASIMTTLDKAIEDLQQSDRTPVGTYDYVYKGNAQKWIKFAYGLKARYTMRLIHRSADKQGDLNKVLDYVSKSFASADEEAAYAVYDANNINPFFGFFESRAAFANSQSLADKLIERKDPRLERVMLSPTREGKRIQVTGADDKNLAPAPNGTPDQNMQKYGVSAFVYSNTAPTMLMSYHELKFLQAEALCRLNRTSDAEAALKQAVAAGIANAERSVASAIDYMGADMVVNTEEMTAEVANAYFENQVKPLFSANPLKETMIQKYLALWGASGEATETFNDLRRMKALGENFVTLANTKKFPLRLPYGNSDVISNPEVKAAYGDGQYVYSEPVWWAGGTR
ncbi:SusD/RagB family nutrient-binding outer membrane lipoprotein [Parabacteroides sp.]